MLITNIFNKNFKSHFSNSAFLFLAEKKSYKISHDESPFCEKIYKQDMIKWSWYFVRIGIQHTAKSE